MRTFTRRAADAVLPLAIVGIVAFQVAGPASPAPAALPTDTFSHVEIAVDDSGMRVVPDRVPAGQVEFTVTDNRTDQGDELTVAVMPPGLTLRPGAQLVATRVLQTYELAAYADSSKLHVRPLTVQMPELAPPTEPADVVTLEVRDSGVSTPARESRFEQPLPAGMNGDAPPDGRAWTAVEPGDITIRVANRTGSRLQCTLEGDADEIHPAAGSRATLYATLVAAGPSGPSFYVLTCLEGKRAPLRPLGRLSDRGLRPDRAVDVHCNEIVLDPARRNA